jgi:hypothetical protein
VAAEDGELADRDAARRADREVHLVHIDRLSAQRAEFERGEIGERNQCQQEQRKDHSLHGSRRITAVGHVDRGARKRREY